MPEGALCQSCGAGAGAGCGAPAVIIGDFFPLANLVISWTFLCRKGPHALSG
jgi:hypothetical protein